MMWQDIIGGCKMDFYISSLLNLNSLEEKKLLESDHLLLLKISIIWLSTVASWHVLSSSKVLHLKNGMAINGTNFSIG